LIKFSRLQCTEEVVEIIEDVVDEVDVAEEAVVTEVDGVAEVDVAEIEDQHQLLVMVLKRKLCPPSSRSTN